MTSNKYLPNSGEKGRDTDRLSSDGSTETVYQNGLHDYETTGDFGEPTANAVDIAGTFQKNQAINLSGFLNYSPPYYSCQGRIW